MALEFVTGRVACFPVSASLSVNESEPCQTIPLSV